ncbi:MAG: hypothetical protein GY943_15855, partial [Chloroflexi bacterium]|nr:hypothetical protein [Chloroflexota bacterium]
MKKLFRFLPMPAFNLFVGFIIFLVLTLHILQNNQTTAAQESNPLTSQSDTDKDIWSDITISSVAQRNSDAPLPSRFRLLSANMTQLDKVLAHSPAESTTTNLASPHLISLPMPDGTFQQFQLEAYSMITPPHPDITTYRVSGIDDATATGTLDRTPAGFHGMIISATDGTIFISPYSQNNITEYISYYKRDTVVDPKNVMDLDSDIVDERPFSLKVTTQANAVSTSVGTFRREYDIAVAATAEYTAYFGGKTQAFAA